MVMRILSLEIFNVKNLNKVSIFFLNKKDNFNDAINNKLYNIGKFFGKILKKSRSIRCKKSLNNFGLWGSNP